MLKGLSRLSARSVLLPAAKMSTGHPHPPDLLQGTLSLDPASLWKGLSETLVSSGHYPAIAAVVILIFQILKAIPHRDCASDFEHNFSSDWQNRCRFSLYSIFGIMMWIFIVSLITFQNERSIFKQSAASCIYFENAGSENLLKKFQKPLDKSRMMRYNLYCCWKSTRYASVLELADRHVWGACVSRRTGSSPVTRTRRSDWRRSVAFFYCEFSAMTGLEP